MTGTLFLTAPDTYTHTQRVDTAHFSAHTQRIDTDHLPRGEKRPPQRTDRPVTRAEFADS